MALEPVGIRAVIEGLNTYLSGTRDMATSTARVGTAAGQVERAATQARGPLLGLGSAFSSVAKIAAGFVVAQGLFQLPGLFSSITSAASNLNESINAVGVIFGTSSERILAFSKTAAESVGLSARAFNELATPLGALLKNAGLPIGAVSDRTIELTKRASDLASVFNTDVSEALGAIQAALRGETEPIRRFGITLNEAAIAAEAQALGLAKVTVNSADVDRALLNVEKAQLAHNKAMKENGVNSIESRDAAADLREAQEKLTAARKGDAAELTQGQKLQAAYSLIMKQSAAVQGDFANTAEGAANRTRILQARQENLRAELGQRFLPLQIKFLEIQNAIVSVIVSKVVPAIDKLIITLTPLGRVLGQGLEAALKIAVLLPTAFLKLPPALQILINPIAGIALNFQRVRDVVEPLIRLFASGFSGATIGGEFASIERAAFNMGQIVSGVVGAFRDLSTAAGELFHLFQVGVSGGEIGGQFSDAERAAFAFGKVVREDVIPTVQAMAGFYAALALEITNVVKRVAEFLQSSGLLESFGLGVLTLAQGFIKFVQIVADVLRPIYGFFRDNETARTILAVAAVIAAVASGIGLVPVAVIAAVTAIGFLRKNLQEITDFINRYVIGTIQSLVDAYLYIPRQLAGVGAEIASTIIDGITGAASKIREVAGDVVGWFKAGFTGYLSIYTGIGQAIVDGVWEGIRLARDGFLRKIGDFFTDAVDYVKGKLGIGSPSKEGEYIGEMFALGVQQGIQSGARGVQKASASLLGDLRRLWNDNREFEPIIADVRRVTNAAGRPDLAQAFEQAWKQLANWARSQPASSGQGTPQQQQAYLAEWNMRKNDLFRTIEQAASGSGTAISGFNLAVDTGTGMTTKSLGTMNSAIGSGSKAIVGTINGFTNAAGSALASLGKLATAGGGGGGGQPSPSSSSTPAPTSYTRTIAAGYAYGKAPPPPPPSAPTATAPTAPVVVTVNGPAIPGLAAITHAAVDSAFAKAQNQSVRQGALLPNGIG